MSNGEESSRVTAIVVLVIGLGLGALVEYQLRTEKKFSPKLLMAVPLLVSLGALGLINPKLVNPWDGDLAGTPGLWKFKIITGVVGVSMLALGLYVAHVLENGGWLPQFLLDHFKLNG